jgi:acetyl esterase
MALDKEAQWVFDLIKQSGRPALNTLSPTEAKALFEQTALVLAPKPVPLPKIEDIRIPGPGGDIPARVYVASEAKEPQPALVFYHGGGWVIGSLNSYDPLCRVLAKKANCTVISIDYRLAPEHKFPAAYDDSVAAYRWIAANTAKLNIDPARIAVGGDSAGGNLSACVTQAARGDQVKPCFQMLIYPGTDMRMGHRSHVENAEGYILTRDLITWFVNLYLRDEKDKTDVRASPLLCTDFTGLPPAFVLLAAYDPLRDEGREYAEKLNAAGVPVRVSLYPGMYHGFFNASGALNNSKHAVEEAAAALRVAFGNF